MFVLQGDPTVYWTLKIIVFAIMIFCGWRIMNIKEDEEGYNKSFWKWTSPVIIAYSLFEGLRWNRGADYPHYYQDLTRQLFSDYKEPLYLLWISFFKDTGLPFWVAFIFYSFLLILGVSLIVKKFPKTAMWAFPVFLIVTASAENLIRQYLAAAFVLFALYNYLQENKKLTVLFCVCAVCIHQSALFAIGVAIAIELLKRFKYLNNVFLPLVLFILTYYFWDENYFQFVADFLQGIVPAEDSNLTTFTGYLDDTDRWFTTEGDLNDRLGRAVGTLSFLYTSSKFLTNLFIIGLGWFVMKKNPKLTIIYWFSAWAIILDNIRGAIEMYGRFYNWLIFLLPIIVGAIAVEQIPAKYLKYKYCVIVVFLIQYLFYGVIKGIGTIGYAGCAFIWDM